MTETNEKKTDAARNRGRIVITSFEGAMYAFEVALGFTEQDTKDMPIFCAISARWEF